MSESNHESVTLFHFKLVAKIAMLVALMSVVGMLAAILWVTDDSGASYGSVIMGRSLTQQKLVPVMVLFGLFSVCIAATATWLIALYSSHRIAGPLFRFAENIHSIREDAFVSPIAIRQSDMLQRDWQAFEAAQRRLREHYGDLRDALAACQQNLSPPGAEPDFAASLAKLQEVECRVQL